MDELSLKVDASASPVRVIVAGELDLDGGDRLEALVAQLQGDGNAEVALDLSGVTFMDSSGLGAVISVSQGGGHVRLDDASPEVLRVLEITGTTEVLDLGVAAEVHIDVVPVPPGP